VKPWNLSVVHPLQGPPTLLVGLFFVLVTRGTLLFLPGCGCLSAITVGRVGCIDPNSLLGGLGAIHAGLLGFTVELFVQFVHCLRLFLDLRR
jgi:hypothetical protein